MQKPLSLLSRLNHPAGTLLITAALYLVFIVLPLAFHGFDPSFFIAAGDRFCDSDLVPEKIIIENSPDYRQPITVSHSSLFDKNFLFCVGSIGEIGLVCQGNFNLMMLWRQLAG